ncbi:MAG: response regulator [Aliifodinibius sp.]|nr:response regulator [Fodinibius sp.]
MKLRIFVIDDEEGIRDTLKWHLEGEGHEVVTAESPVLCENCYALTSQSPYPCADLLFTDYQMPHMTGLEFIEKMNSLGCRMDPYDKYLMSGNIDAIDLSKVQRVGCQVLQKPISFKQIDKIVESRIQDMSPEWELNDFCELLRA